MKVLAVGDIHLGRQPSRLPEVLRHRSYDLGPSGAWERIVEAALAEKVRAVVLAGDVVESENDFFEAYRELFQGVSKLAQAGITVYGVAGNHDGQVLPRLSDHVQGFRLLGRNGQWESVIIEDESEQLTLWGWSFPQARVTGSPLKGGGPERLPGLNIGLLHCDRNQPGSSYAPVTSQELELANLDGWLLGHVHKPDRLVPPYPVGYLGSVTGLDPGETGLHGPWLITLQSGRIQQVTQWALAPLRWDQLPVDLTGISEAAQACSKVLDALRVHDAHLSRERWTPEAVGLRLSFEGVTHFGREAATLFLQEDQEHIYSGECGAHFFIERLDTLTKPGVSLNELARRTDPAGLLARRLVVLDCPKDDPERQALLARARHRLEMQQRDARWSGLRLKALDDETVAGWLRHSGSSLLEQMLAQREAMP